MPLSLANAGMVRMNRSTGIQEETINKIWFTNYVQRNYVENLQIIKFNFNSIFKKINSTENVYL